ncbi:hypothetical protein [Nitratifractor sp.]
MVPEEQLAPIVESFFCIGFLPAFFLSIRQRLHDQIDGYLVVHA